MAERKVFVPDLTRMYRVRWTDDSGEEIASDHGSFEAAKIYACDLRYFGRFDVAVYEVTEDDQ